MAKPVDLRFNSKTTKNSISFIRKSCVRESEDEKFSPPFAYEGVKLAEITKQDAYRCLYDKNKNEWENRQVDKQTSAFRKAKDEIAQQYEMDQETERYVQNTLETDLTCTFDKSKWMEDNLGRIANNFK